MTTDHDRQAALAWFAAEHDWHNRHAKDKSSSEMFRDYIVAAYLAGFEAGQRAGAKLADRGYLTDEQIAEIEAKRDNFQEIRPPGLPSAKT